MGYGIIIDIVGSFERAYRSPKIGYFFLQIMKNFKKAFSLIILILVLYQALAFGLSEKHSNLRPPMQFNTAAKNFIEKGGADAPKEEIKIVTPMEITLTDEERYNSWIQKNSKDHLVLCRTRQLIQKEETSRFKGFPSSTTMLIYNVAEIKKNNAYQYILAVSEMMPGRERPLRTWAAVDNEGRFIVLERLKKSTLPAIYVSDQDSYDLLSRYTYKWREVNGRHVYINEGYLFHDEGEPLIEYPYTFSSIKELLTIKRTVNQGI